ncbi:MAG TPA: FG-GAP-like repeat-containing protein [Candidatus Acidoferrales bacterium]|nr:FG-GAP-like repeat-containing protein [Candidatus Acidoferrales bacterium]
MPPSQRRTALLAFSLALVFLVSFVLRISASAQSGKATARASAEAAQRNNLGVAYMNRQQQKQALEEFQKATALDPDLYAARLNQAIAFLNLQQFPQAQSILEEASKREPRNPRVWYNLGLLEKSLGHPDVSARDFERVAALNPSDADCRYFLGQDYMTLRDYSKAIAAFEIALKLNPFNVSALFALAQAYQRSGSTARAKESLARFQDATQKKLGTPMSLTYGDQGKYSLAEEVSPGLEPVPAPIPVHFVDVTSASGLPTRTAPRRQPSGTQDAASFGSGACIFDFDGDGRPDILLADADGSGRPGLYHNLGGGRFEDVTQSSDIQIPGAGMGCTIGDYDNDGHPDIAISYDNGVALFHNEGNGKFRDVTAAAGIHMNGQAMGLTFVDYDHDGDLDLYVTRAAKLSESSPVSTPNSLNQLWRNNGNGTFTDVTAQTGLGGTGPSWGATASDINNDRAVDFVVTAVDGPPAIYFNPREGLFREEQPWSPTMPAPAVGALALDFNKDGWMDLAFTHSGSPGLSLWRNVDGKKFIPEKLPALNWTRGWGLASLDYDNDGWIDLAAAMEDAVGGHIVLLRNEGPAGFRDVSKAVGLDQISVVHPRSVVAADFFGDGATDLLITQNDATPLLLRNEGGNRHHWLKLALKGLNDNKSAIGARVDVFAGALRQRFEIPAASGYMGQSDTAITVGLGGAKAADIVRMLWPTGVLQDEINFPTDSAQTITELDRHGSSCPILFAWDGHKFQFISDILGSGIVGHWIAPSQRNIPDPQEYVKLSSSDLQPRNNLLSLRLLEPMEELDYLDQVRLLAVDHPGKIEVYPNAYFSMNPPFPDFNVIASSDAHLPLGAWDDHGTDVLTLISKRDHEFIKSFEALPYAGFAKLHWIDLDLGDWNPRRPLRLIIDGFTDYFSASSLYAAWQAGLKPIPPYVEELDSASHWRRVVDEMGFPGGLERTMTTDLTGKLQPGTRRIRIATNLKIYWDRILIDNSPTNTPYRISSVPLANANLEFRGYPRYSEGRTPGDLSYDYDEVSATGPYAQQTGNYTRYGEVRSLLTRVDEEYVVFGSGDEVAVDFEPSILPKLPRGWVRDYFFYANGFDKDMDFYADYGGTVGPLPIHGLRSYPYPSGIGFPEDSRHLEYFLHYNTRGVSGSAPKSYRFRYHHEGQ